jgi:fluoride exporter
MDDPPPPAPAPHGSLLYQPDPRGHRRSQQAILLAVAVAGAGGALARYGVGELISVPRDGFPWGTFWVNVSGGVLIGLVLVLLRERFSHARLARPLAVTGFLGAYTTFSTYTVGSDVLFRAHDIRSGILYALASLLAGIVAVLGGILLARAALGTAIRREQRS